MDEPLSNLDAKLRVQTRAELVELQRRLAGDGRLRHPRPGRGDDDGAPHRDHERRRAPAGRAAAGRLRAAGEPVRGPVHRQPADEHRRPARSSPTAAALASRVEGEPRAAAARRTQRPSRPPGLDAGRASACGPSTSSSAAEGVLPATVTVVESLGHERHVICRLDGRQMVIVRQRRPTPGAGRGVDGAPRRRPRAPPPVRRRDRAAAGAGAVSSAGDSATLGAVPTSASRRPRRGAAAPAAAAVRRGVDAARSASRTSCCSRRCVIFGVFVFYPFLQELLPRLLPDAAVPGAARALRRASTSTATCSRRTDFLDSLKTTVVFAFITVPAGIALGLGLAVLAHQQLQGHRRLPHDLLVDGRDVGRGRVGDLRHAVEPAGRPAAVARDQPDAADPGEPATGRCPRSRSSRSGRRSGSRSS